MTTKGRAITKSKHQLTVQFSKYDITTFNIAFPVAYK